MTINLVSSHIQLRPKTYQDSFNKEFKNLRQKYLNFIQVGTLKINIKKWLYNLKG